MSALLPSAPAPAVRGSRHRLRHERLKRRRRRVGLLLVAALSFLAGLTDAIGFLAIGNFVSFMSGNTTQLAISLSRADAGAAAFLVLVIATYVAGNALGIIALAGAGRRHELLLALISSLLLAAALAPGPQDYGPAILLAVLAMGLVNAVVERVDGHSFGITYITGALSRFGRGLGRWLLGDRSPGWRLEIVPFLGMLAGAVTGASIEAAHGRFALLAPAGLSLALTIAAFLIPKAWRQDYRVPIHRAKA